MRILVTGGAGFIGSHFVRKLLSESDVHEVSVLDSLTYAGNLANLSDFVSDSRFRFVKGDICDLPLVRNLTQEITHIVNFAAESHVDRSISDSGDFIKTNIVGTHTLLTAAKELSGVRFLQVSTDEVYGSINNGEWDEDCPLLPNSPYSASKASADLIVRSFFNTYGVDTVTTRCSNNFGPNQYPEKLIPLSIIRLSQGKNISIYGNGLNVRDWLHVSDHCDGIYLALRLGKKGSTYNFGAGAEKNNLEIAHEILTTMQLGSDRIDFIEDRKGHDFRYAVSFSKASSELGFTPRIDFNQGLKDTVHWYLNNKEWWQGIVRQ